MIGRLQTLLRDLAQGPTPPPDPDRIPLAMAGVLVEAARADHRLEDGELDRIATLLADRLELEAAAARSLVERARHAVEASVSLHEFTRPLHESLNYQQKEAVVGMLWHVALADRQLDRYEEYLIGKVAELLYIARGDVIRLRHQAIQAIQAAARAD